MKWLTIYIALVKKIVSILEQVLITDAVVRRGWLECSMAEKRMFLKGLLWGSAACGEAHKKGNFLAYSTQLTHDKKKLNWLKK